MHIFYFASCNYDKLLYSQWHRKLVNGIFAARGNGQSRITPTRPEKKWEWKLFRFKRRATSKNSNNKGMEISEWITKMDSAIQMKGRKKLAQREREREKKEKEFHEKTKKKSQLQEHHQEFRAIFLPFALYLAVFVSQIFLPMDIWICNYGCC